MEKLLRVPQVASILGTSTGRTYELIRMGLLPAVRLGKQVRVSPEKLREFMATGGKPLPSDARGTHAGR